MFSFAYLLQRRMNKGATEEINILECFKFLTTWSLEHRTILEKNGGLSHMYLQYSLAVPHVVWVGKLLNLPRLFLPL